MKRAHQFIILIFIALIMVGVVAFWPFTWIQEKLGFSSIDDKTLANQAAELALKEAETWLSQQPTKPIGVQNCSKPPCLVWKKGALPPNLSTAQANWWQTQGRPYSKKIVGVKIQPRYVIEEYQFVPQEMNPDELSKQTGYSYYRITAKGKGKSENSHSILESIYSVKFN
jgi:Tfp pilus assembly protein PilX